MGTKLAPGRRHLHPPLLLLVSQRPAHTTPAHTIPAQLLSPAYVFTTKETRPLPAPLPGLLQDGCSACTATPGQCRPRWAEPLCTAWTALLRHQGWSPLLPPAPGEKHGRKHQEVSPQLHTGQFLLSCFPIASAHQPVCCRPEVLPTASPQMRKGSLPPACQGSTDVSGHTGRKVPGAGPCSQTQRPAQGLSVPWVEGWGSHAPWSAQGPSKAPESAQEFRWLHLQGLAKRNRAGRGAKLPQLISRAHRCQPAHPATAAAPAGREGVAAAVPVPVAETRDKCCGAGAPVGQDQTAEQRKAGWRKDTGEDGESGMESCQDSRCLQWWP